jgi:hypothetical protein
MKNEVSSVAVSSNVLPVDDRRNFDALSLMELSSDNLEDDRDNTVEIGPHTLSLAMLCAISERADRTADLAADEDCFSEKSQILKELDEMEKLIKAARRMITSSQSKSYSYDAE